MEQKVVPKLLQMYNIKKTNKSPNPLRNTQVELCSKNLKYLSIQLVLLHLKIDTSNLDSQLLGLFGLLDYL